MAFRKAPKELQDIFDRFGGAKDVRRLDKDDAIRLLTQEFNLTPTQALQMFETFDKDKNGVMSLWEFQQFHSTIGKSAQEMIDKFMELDQDNSGKLDISEAQLGLKGMGLAEKETEFFIKSSLGDDGLIDIAAFGSLLFRLKVYQQKKK